MRVQQQQRGMTEWVKTSRPRYLVLCGRGGNGKRKSLLAALGDQIGGGGGNMRDNLSLGCVKIKMSKTDLSMWIWVSRKDLRCVPDTWIVSPQIGWSHTTYRKDLSWEEYVKWNRDWAGSPHVLAHQTTLTKIPKTGKLEQQTFTSHILKAGKSKVKVLADLMSG